MHIAALIGLEHEDGCGPRKASRSSLDRFERRFNLRLPAAYREMLSEVNGGIPRLRRFKRRGRVDGVINSFFFLGKENKKVSLEDGWDYENLWDETCIARQMLDLPLVPFANDGEGGLFAFTGNEGGIIWIDSTNRDSRIDLVPSFEELVSQLVE